MDTVENRWVRTTVKGQSQFKCVPPIIWRDKSAKEVHRDEYPELKLKQNAPPPISTRVGVDYCRSFSVTPYTGEDDGIVTSTLTEIDR